MNCSWEFTRDLFGYSSPTFLPFRNNSPDEDLTAIVLNMKPHIASDVATLLPSGQSLYFGIECKESASTKIRTLLEENLLSRAVSGKENYENDSLESMRLSAARVYILEPETKGVAAEGVKRFAIWMTNNEFMDKTLEKILNVISNQRKMGRSALPQSIVKDIIQKAKSCKEI